MAKNDLIERLKTLSKITFGMKNFSEERSSKKQHSTNCISDAYLHGYWRGAANAYRIVVNDLVRDFPEISDLLTDSSPKCGSEKAADAACAEGPILLLAKYLP